MRSSLRAAVIGSGFGGLAAAIRLANAGVTVTVYEARDLPAGRAYVHRDNGYTLDAGPRGRTGAARPRGRAGRAGPRAPAPHGRAVARGGGPPRRLLRAVAGRAVLPPRVARRRALRL